MQLTQPNDAAVVAVKAQLARITALSAVVEETLSEGNAGGTGSG